MKQTKLCISRAKVNNVFKMNAITAAIMTLSSLSYAQEEKSGDNIEVEEEVVHVVGLRSSLNKASEIKRNASGVVEAISATDVGKFPDTNLAESLQRITGVSIDRSNGEGQQITVRGFGPRFNLVTLNGRSLPTSSALATRDLNRSFNFNELAASSISVVEVYKTGRADLPTGGIGSTVNIITAKPFDYDGAQATGSFKFNSDKDVVNGSDFTPEATLLLSNHYFDKKLGLLTSLSFSERDSRAESAIINDYRRATPEQLGPFFAPNFDVSQNQNPENEVFLARNFALGVADVERERINGQFVIQYAPTDDLEIDLDYQFSRFKELSIRNQTAFWFGFDAGRTGVSNPTGAVNLRDNNQDIDFFGLVNDLETENDSFGINVDWIATESLSFVLDAHVSTSKSQPDGQVAEVLTNFNSAVADVSVGLDFVGADIPNIIIDTPTNQFTQDAIKGDIGSFFGNQVENEINELKFSGRYDFFNKAITSVSAGIAYQEYTYESAATASGNLSLASLDFSTLNVDFIDRNGVGDDFSGGEGLFPTLGFYDPREAIALAIDQGVLVQPEALINRAEEETTSLFVSADFSTEIGGMNLDANVGLRYEQTDVLGSTLEQDVIGTRFFSEGELSIVRSSDVNFNSLDGEYSVLLPSLDFKLNVTEDIVTRLSYSETITRSPISILTPNTSFQNVRPGDGDASNGVFSAVQGNPNIEPAEAENIDLSFEWYYAEGSYASIGFFSKKVNAFVNSVSEERNIIQTNGEPLRDASINPAPGCPDPVNPACLSDADDPAILFNVSTPQNSDESGTVDGFELALQHTFESGFGFIANYTYTDGDIEFDKNNFVQPDPLPLEGLSDSANLILFYEKGQYQARLAYNWRDEFLTGVFAQDPFFVESRQQLDFSATYYINEEFSVFVEAVNLTDEYTRVFRRFEEQLVNASATGPRFGFGVRAKF